MGSSPLAGVRSILEVPILDAHKWGKVPQMPVHAVLLDLEDSVQPARKAEARQAVVAQISRAHELGNKIPIPRCNRLDTPFGHDDLRALGEAGVRLLAYPKVEAVEELESAREILGVAGANPQFVPIIESARAVLGLEAIAAHPLVAGLMFGPFDLAVDAGITPFDGDGMFNDAYHYAKSKLALCGAAYEVPTYDLALTPELKNLDQVRKLAEHSQRMGISGMTTFYPPHVPIINEVFAPSPAEVAEARELVSIYEQALAAGDAAAQLHGKAVIVQDYKTALRTLDRAHSD